MLMNREGQGLLEYAVLFTVGVAALIAMQIYVKRGIAGGLRNAADSIGEQYDPLNTQTEANKSLIVTIESDTVSTAELKKGEPIDEGKTGDVMVTETVTITNETSRSGTETVGALADSSFWPD